MKLKLALMWLVIQLMTICCSNGQTAENAVKVVGQMKDVMWRGKLDGNIYLDTLAVKTNLYGLGPVEHLTGEILIIDGKSYQSTVVCDSVMKVEQTFNIKAPFFGYTNIAGWIEQDLPDSILTIQQLEKYLVSLTSSYPKPYIFKVSGTVEKATIHIVVNLPKGTKVSSPAQAHQGQITYHLTKEDTEIVGFFSTEHRGVFTHHDTFLHMHMITADSKKMGHLDEAFFRRGTMKLYLPTD